MKLCIILCLYAMPMAALFALSSANDLLGIGSKILAFVLFLAYSILGGFLFRSITQRGLLP